MIDKILNNMHSKLLAGLLIAFSMPVFAQTGVPESTADSTQSVKLKESFLTRKVTVPYGNDQKRTLITSSISSVSGDELQKTNTPNLGNTLFGRLSGLYVGQNGGSPGDNSPNLMIRGRQTFLDNGILILVDGLETKYSSLSPYEVESVTVLKDAAALALYGMKGANGVVLITTKRGFDSKKNIITFNSRFGMQSATVMPSLLGAGDYAELYNKAMVSDGKLITNGYFKDDSIVSIFKTGKYPTLYPDVDWYNEMLKSSAISQDYNLSVQGGNSYAKYFVLLGYADYQGLYKNTDSKKMINSNYNFKQYNLRTNIDVNITDFLRSEIRLRAAVSDKFGPNADENTLWRTMALFNPYAVKTPDVKWGGKQGYAANPVASILQQGYNLYNERQIDASVKLIADLDIIAKGMKWYGQMGFSNNYYNSYQKNRGYAYDDLTPRPDLIVPGVTPAGTMPYSATTYGSTDDNFTISHGAGSQWNRTTIITGITYDTSIKNHNIGASVNYFQELYRGAASDLPYAKQNILGRIAYNYSEKYLAEFGFSYAGSENFPKGKRFGFFPTISAGWLLSKENFLRDNSTVNLLKIRGSYGLLGNDRVGGVGRFIFNTWYTGAGSYQLGTNFGSSSGMSIENNLANPNVTWEKAYKSNIGLDVVLFHKLSFAADYYAEKRNDIFINPYNSIPVVMGATFYYVNKGKTKSNGLELELTFQDKLGDLGYTLGGNFAWSRNSIVSMEEPPQQFDYLYAKGKPIGQPYALEAIGYFKDQADIASSPTQLFGAVRPGDIKYKDQNGDGLIDNNDRKPIGYTAYPEIVYAFNAGVDFKGFDFSILFQGVAHRTVSLLDNNNIVPFLNGGVKPTSWVRDNYWTPERGDAALFPRLTTEANPNNYQSSTLWQRDGSFIRLKNVEFGYTFPQLLIQKFKLSKLRIYVNASNLFTWDKISELNVDPEIMNMFVYPAMKSYNVGLSIQF